MSWANGLHAVAALTWPAVGGSFYLAFLITSGFSSSDAGSLRSGHLLVATVAQLCLGCVSRHVSAVTLAVVAITVGAITLGATPLLGGLPLIAAAGCVGGVSWIYLPMVAGLAAEHTDRTEHSLSVALFNATWSLTNPTALLIVGVTVERTSLSSAFLLSGTCALFCSGLLWIWGSRRKLP